MSLLFMMPQWEATSEVWMHRMLAGLSEYLAAVLVSDSQGNRYWRGEVPAISLNPSEQSVRYASRVCAFFGLTLKKKKPKERDILQKALRRLPVDRVLCHYGTFATKFMEVWERLDLPLFIHFHGYDATFDLRNFDQPDKRFHPADYLFRLKDLERRAIFIANSEFTKCLLTDAGIAESRVFVKYYGVPIADEKRLHHKTTGLRILHLGRLVDFKSPDRTIKAFEIAKSRGLDGDLVIGGEGALRAYCELLRLRSPYKSSIHILGAVNTQQAQVLFSEADIFTQHNIVGEITRQSECFGVSIVEAMAQGLPVVCTRNGGVIESVVHEETGFLNSPEDIEAQANSFLELARHPELRQQMGEAGQARVNNFFSPQREIENLCKIMKLSVVK
jgi:glycosyltransferase involved in cell wall biosynthesis